MALSKTLRYQILRRDNHACRYCGAAAPDVKLTVDHVVPVTLGGTDDPANLITACQTCNSGKSATPPDASLVGDVAADALRWARAMEIAARNLLADRELREAVAQRFQIKWQEWTYPETVVVPPEPTEPTGDVLVDNWHTLLSGWSRRHCRPVSFTAGVLTVQIERGHFTDVKAEFRRRDTRDRLADLLGDTVDQIHVADGWPGPLPEPPRSTTRVERRTFPLPTGWQSSVERFAALGLPEEEMHRFVDVAMEKAIPANERFRFFCGCCWRAVTELQEAARAIVATEDDDIAP